MRRLAAGDGAPSIGRHRWRAEGRERLTRGGMAEADGSARGGGARAFGAAEADEDAAVSHGGSRADLARRWSRRMQAVKDVEAPAGWRPAHPRCSSHCASAMHEAST